MIEFLREHVRDTSGEEADGRAEPEMMACTATKTEGGESEEEAPPAFNEPKSTTINGEAPMSAVSHVPAVDEHAQIPAETSLITSAALDAAKDEPAADDAEEPCAPQALPKAEEPEGMEVASKKGGGDGLPGSRRKVVAPLDLSMVLAPAWAADHKSKSGMKAGQPTPLKSAAALCSPGSRCPLFQALSSLEELLNRHANEPNDLKRLLAASPSAMSACRRSSLSPLRRSSNSPFGRSSHSPLRQQSPASATHVY